MPNYLINNFNTKPEETANAFYDIRIELLDEYSIDTSQYPSNDIITTNATVSAAENQILTISASSINIVENYGNFLPFSDLKNNKLYTFSGEARISEDGTFGYLQGIDASVDIGDGAIIIKETSEFVPFSYTFVVTPSTSNYISYGVNSGAINAGTVSAEFRNLSLIEEPYFDYNIQNQENRNFWKSIWLNFQL